MRGERLSATANDARTPDAEALRAWWTESWRAVEKEETYEITDIEGEIPREIHGTLYRNGPSQKILPEEGYQ